MFASIISFLHWFFESLKVVRLTFKLRFLLLPGVISAVCDFSFYPILCFPTLQTMDLSIIYRLNSNHGTSVQSVSSSSQIKT